MQNGRKARRSRGGRPKGSYRSVAPAGVDIGATAEHLAKRAALLGLPGIGGNDTAAETGAGASDPRAGYPLGILLARALIGTEEHDAGLWYGWLHRRRFGTTLANAAPFYERMGAPLTRWSPAAPDADERQERWERIYREIDAALLLEAGPAARSAVQEIAVYETLPGYLGDDPCRWHAPHPFFDLKLGLGALRGVRTRPAALRAAGAI